MNENIESLLTRVILSFPSKIDTLTSYSWEYFECDMFREIHRAIYSLWQSNLPIDPMNVVKWLRECGGKKIGIGEVIQFVDASLLWIDSDIEPYWNDLRSEHYARVLSLECTTLSKECLDKTKDIHELLAKNKSVIEKIESSFNDCSDVISSAEASSSTMEEIKLRKKQREDGDYLSWGLRDLDELTGGIWPEVIFIAARPSVGKSALAIEVLDNNSHNKPTLIFSQEMSKETCQDRLISRHSGIDLKRIIRGNLSDQDMARIEKEILPKISTMKLFFYDKRCTIDEIKVISRREKKAKGIKLIVIDYFQLIKYAITKKNREEELSNIMHELIELRKEIKIPIIILSQMTRDADTKSKEGPRLRDMSQTDAISTDGDTILILRDKGKDANTDARIIEVIAKKARNSNRGVTELLFDGATQRFSNRDKMGLRINKKEEEKIIEETYDDLSDVPF